MTTDETTSSWAPYGHFPTGSSHKPITIALEEYSVTKDDIEYFNENGYWLCPKKLLSDEQIERLE